MNQDQQKNVASTTNQRDGKPSPRFGHRGLHHQSGRRKHTAFAPAGPDNQVLATLTEEKGRVH